MRQKQVANVLKKMCEEVNTFMCDVIYDSTSEGAVYSTRIESDGTHIKIMICNGKTKTIVGKAFPVKTFVELCMVKDKIEIEINAAVKLMIAKSQKPSSHTVWI